MPLTGIGDFVLGRPIRSIEHKLKNKKKGMNTTNADDQKKKRKEKKKKRIEGNDVHWAGSGGAPGTGGVAPGA